MPGSRSSRVIQAGSVCELRSNALEFLLAFVQADCAIRDRKNCENTPSQMIHGSGWWELFPVGRGEWSWPGMGDPIPDNLPDGLQLL